MNVKQLEGPSLRKNAIYVRDDAIYNYYFVDYFSKFLTTGQDILGVGA